MGLGRPDAHPGAPVVQTDLYIDESASTPAGDSATRMDQAASNFSINISIELSRIIYANSGLGFDENIRKISDFEDCRNIRL